MAFSRHAKTPGPSASPPKHRLVEYLPDVSQRGPSGTFYLVGSILGTDNSKDSYVDGKGDAQLTDGIDAGKPRGAQLTADGALLGDVPNVSDATAPTNGAP